MCISVVASPAYAIIDYSLIIHYVAATGTGLNMFNQQQDSNPQNQLGQQSLQSQLILNAIKAPGPSVFENEKDLVLMQFNWLQACSGTGKGLVNHGGTLHDITFTPESLVCRFKVCETNSKLCTTYQYSFCVVP